MYTKLAELRKRVKGFVKDTEGYNYKYFDINQMIENIQPVAEELGLFISQPIDIEDGKNALKLLVWSAEDTSEKVVLGRMLLPEQTDPQKMGSIITYYRRYMLQSAFFWGAVDDDGAIVTKEPKKASKEQLDTIKKMVDAKGGTIEKTCTWLKVGKLEELTYAQATGAIKKLSE